MSDCEAVCAAALDAQRSGEAQVAILTTQLEHMKTRFKDAKCDAKKLEEKNGKLEGTIEEFHKQRIHDLRDKESYKVRALKLGTLLAMCSCGPGQRYQSAFSKPSTAVDERYLDACDEMKEDFRTNYITGEAKYMTSLGRECEHRGEQKGEHRDKEAEEDKVEKEKDEEEKGKRIPAITRQRTSNCLERQIKRATQHSEAKRMKM